MSVTFSQLTQQQQSLLESEDIEIRKDILASRALLARFRARDISYRGTTKAIYDSLASGEQVPTTTQLTGAMQVPHEATVALIVAFQGLLASWDSDAARLDHSQFVGAVNIDGQA